MTNPDGSLAREKLKDMVNKVSQGRSTQKETKTERKSYKATEASTDAQTSVQNSEIYAILTNSDLDSEEKIAQISEKLLFDYEDTENTAQFEAVGDVRNIVKVLINNFTDQNRESIRLTAENPLSELTKSIKSVFANYDELLSGRTELKDKLEKVRTYLDSNGDPEALLNSLREAKGMQKKKDGLVNTRDEFSTQKQKLDEKILRSSSAVSSLSHQLSKETQAAEQAQIQADKFGKNLLNKWFRGKKLSELRQHAEYAKLEKKSTESSLESSKEQLEQASSELSTVDGKLSAADAALAAFLADGYEGYEELLSILDIGDEAFKNKLQTIANQSLQYIDDTQGTLIGVRDQLEVLLEEVKKNLNVSINSSENIKILEESLKTAQEKNVEERKAYDARYPDGEVASVDEIKVKAVKRRSAEFISAVESNMTSAIQIATNTEMHRTTLGQMRTDLEGGLADAESQLLKAVTTSAVTGNAILNRVQRLAANTQSLFAEGMFDTDMREATNGIMEDFSESLAQRFNHNNKIAGFSQVITEITDALDTKNDGSVAIAQDTFDLINKLRGNLDNLQVANERNEQLQTEISKMNYGINDNAPQGQQKRHNGPKPEAA